MKKLLGSSYIVIVGILSSLLGLNRSEKEQYVIRLYQENKSTREIAKLMHMSFRRIGAIIKKVNSEAEGERGSSVDTNDYDIKSKSKITQAIKLFSEFKSPIDVIIALIFQPIKYGQYIRNIWNLTA